MKSLTKPQIKHEMDFSNFRDPERLKIQMSFFFFCLALKVEYLSHSCSFGRKSNIRRNFVEIPNKTPLKPPNELSNFRDPKRLKIRMPFFFFSHIYHTYVHSAKNQTFVETSLKSQMKPLKNL